MQVIYRVMLFLSLCTVVSCVQTIEPPVIKYEGPIPQTLEAILETFADKPTIADYNVGFDVDGKYSVKKWIQMLIDKGIVIEDSYDFEKYRLLRRWLKAEEREYLDQPDMWLPKKYFGETHNSWETYEDAYIDRKVWEYKQIKAAKQADPSVHRVEFLGPDGRTVLPLPDKSVIINRGYQGYGITGGGNYRISEQQMWDIVFKGKHTRGWKVVYIDDMGNILSEKPAPISREELELPPDVPWPPKNRAHLDRIYDDVRQGRYNLEDN